MLFVETVSVTALGRVDATISLFAVKILTTFIIDSASKYLFTLLSATP